MPYVTVHLSRNSGGRPFSAQISLLRAPHNAVPAYICLCTLKYSTYRDCGECCGCPLRLQSPPGLAGQHCRPLHSLGCEDVLTVHLYTPTNITSRQSAALDFPARECASITSAAFHRRSHFTAQPTMQVPKVVAEKTALDMHLCVYYFGTRYPRRRRRHMQTRATLAAGPTSPFFPPTTKSAHSHCPLPLFFFLFFSFLSPHRHLYLTFSECWWAC